MLLKKIVLLSLFNINRYILILSAGEDISGVHDVPSTYAEMKENIERILHFMSAKKIRMHHIMAKGMSLHQELQKQ